MLAGVAITIYMTSDQIILGQLAGNEALGVYSVAVRISSIWYFVPVTIMSSLFPVILAARKRSLTEFYQRLEQAFWFLGALSLGVALIVTFTANWIIQLLFGPVYAEAGPILAVHIWAGIPVAIGVVASSWTIAENKTQIALQKTTFGAVTNVLLNFLLIPIYGAMGAAIATVIAYTIATFIWHIVDRRMVPIDKIQFAALFPKQYLKSIQMITGEDDK
jgi:PST family polysaccharide transporter